MKKSIFNLVALLLGVSVFATNSFAAERVSPVNTAAKQAQTEEPTTNGNVVVFKVHDIKPVSSDGVVTGCDFTLTLYNRTSVNFRSFTLNMDWKDSVQDNFKFDKYVESILGSEEAAKQKQFINSKFKQSPLQTSITVNAFGADKQISINSHIDSEKCYLMLNKASYSVTPCDIVRNMTSGKGLNIGTSGTECSALFQMVDTSNPEYFGVFKDISATELASKNKEEEKRELSDVDLVVDKIVENLGVSGKTLAEIN
jgi:hypothetical protein